MSCIADAVVLDLQKTQINDLLALPRRLFQLADGRFRRDYRHSAATGWILHPLHSSANQRPSSLGGIAVPDLHLREIKTFKIPLPPMSIQNVLVTLIERHERLRSIQREALRQSAHLFQSLLHEAFSSQLD